MASWNLRSGGAVKPLGSLPPPKKGCSITDMDKFMISKLAGTIIHEKQDKNQASSHLGFLINIIFAVFKEDPHVSIIRANDLTVTPKTLKGHASSVLIGITASKHDKPVHLYDSQKKWWNWVFPSGNSTAGSDLSNKAQVALFLNIIATAVANTIKTDDTNLLSRRQCIWMADWSSQCMTGSTGYNQKPDLVLISNTIASCDEITWLSPKVIREYSRESFQPASHIRKTMDMKAYLVLVDQSWRHFVLRLSLANDKLWVHFYDRSSGLISPPFNIHVELDSFLYILSRLVFGICSCIGFDMSIKISPPPINSRRAHLTALLLVALPGSTMSPPAKSVPPMKSQLLCVDSPQSLLSFESQPPSGDQTPLSMPKPAVSMPKLLSSSPEMVQCIGTI